MFRLRLLFLLILGMVGSLFARAGVAGSEPAAGAGLCDLAGHAANVFSGAADRLMVFVFVRTDCPVANVYAPEIQRLAKKYGGSGVSFALVYSDPDETAAVIRKHLTEYGYHLEAYRDPKLAFARRSKVAVTPEAAVYRGDGRLLYHGRIDDRYAGRPVPEAKGEAVGCYIEGL